MPAVVNIVQIMSVDESSEGYWAKPKLEGHSVKMQIDTGLKASLVSHKIQKEIHCSVQWLNCKASCLRYQGKLSCYNGACIAKGNMA